MVAVYSMIYSLRMFQSSGRFCQSIQGRRAPLCMLDALYKKMQVGIVNESRRATVTKGACENLCHECKITHGSLRFSTKQNLHPFRDHQTKRRSKTRRRMPRVDEQPNAHGWTLQHRNGQKQREGRGGETERQGRESPECKAMFSRNVLPPVLSCNLTGNSPESCLTQAAREGEMWRK